MLFRAYISFFIVMKKNYLQYKQMELKQILNTGEHTKNQYIPCEKVSALFTLMTKHMLSGINFWLSS